MLDDMSHKGIGELSIERLSLFELQNSSFNQGAKVETEMSLFEEHQIRRVYDEDAEIW